MVVMCESLLCANFISLLHKQPHNKLYTSTLLRSADANLLSKPTSTLFHALTDTTVHHYRTISYWFNKHVFANKHLNRYNNILLSGQNSLAKLLTANIYPTVSS